MDDEIDIVQFMMKFRECSAISKISSKKSSVTAKRYYKRSRLPIVSSNSSSPGDDYKSESEELPVPEVPKKVIKKRKSTQTMKPLKPLPKESASITFLRKGIATIHSAMV